MQDQSVIEEIESIGARLLEAGVAVSLIGNGSEAKVMMPDGFVFRMQGETAARIWRNHPDGVDPIKFWAWWCGKHSRFLE